jgi:hypothetical protein
MAVHHVVWEQAQSAALLPGLEGEAAGIELS